MWISNEIENDSEDKVWFMKPDSNIFELILLQITAHILKIINYVIAKKMQIQIQTLFWHRENVSY